MESRREELHQLIDQLSENLLNSASKSLKKLMRNDIPERLYHYTNPQALISILKDKKIWVTNYRYLNDYTELSHAIELAYSQFGESYRQSLDFIASYPFNYAVFSLSAEKDLLSQWRGYCPTGGYAIGFDCQKLESLLQKRGFNGLRRCIYDENDQMKTIGAFVENMPSSIVCSPGFEHLKINMQDFIQQVGLLIKDNGFEEENEWRAISNNISPQFNSSNKLKGFEWKVREKNQLLIPYMEVDLNDEEYFPICEIVVGPCRDQELAEQAVKVAFETFKVKIHDSEKAITKSNIPYRTF